MSDPQPGSPLPPPPPGYPAQQPSEMPPPPGAALPPQSAYQPPPGAPSPSAFAPPPAGYPHQGPLSPMSGALGMAGLSLAQFRGVAGTSVLLGVIGIAVPLLTTLVLSGGGFFFYVLPIFGLIAGVRAVMRGLVIGGAVGIVLNVIAGFISLLMSGVFFGGG